MIRQGDQDFYTLEPTILRNGLVVMPVRWFKFCNDFYASAWLLLPHNEANGWFVTSTNQLELLHLIYLYPFPSSAKAISFVVSLILVIF